MRRKTLAQPPKSPLTPLVDIAFLVLIFFMSLPLRRLDGKLNAHLPKNVGPDAIHAEKESTIEIRVLRRGDKHQYRLGDHRADDPTGLADTLRKLGPHHVYEIHGNPEVKWNAIVKVADLLTGLKHKKVRWHGTRPPSAEQRRLLQLPALADDG